jgi:hypothetical protein
MLPRSHLFDGFNLELFCVTLLLAYETSFAYDTSWWTQFKVHEVFRKAGTVTLYIF